MKYRTAILAAVFGGLLSTSAIADDKSAVTGAAGGAVTGAIVGGPVGAAVGGIIGLTVGAAVPPPPERVVTYVREQPAPVNRVVVEREVVVGQRIPDTVVVTSIPENPAYGYAFVNDRRVLVDPQTGNVIEILD